MRGGNARMDGTTGLLSILSRGECRIGTQGVRFVSRKNGFLNGYDWMGSGIGEERVSGGIMIEDGVSVGLVYVYL